VGEFNLEMACAEEIVQVALDMVPDLATLVPERREEITTEGGLGLARNRDTIAETVRRLQEAGIPVSLFIDPDEAAIRASAELGAQFVELHTGEYSEGRTPEERQPQLERLVEAATLAEKLGLRVHAGHGLNYRNVRPVAELPQVEALYIGHSIVGRAILVGMERAVREMKELVE
jgi:pyridoxine 5-phosphate synthase